MILSLAATYFCRQYGFTAKFPLTLVGIAVITGGSDVGVGGVCEINKPIENTIKASVALLNANFLLG